MAVRELICIICPKGCALKAELDENGKVLHVQDSSFLEEGQGYNKDKVLRFLNNWTPKAVNK